MQTAAQRKSGPNLVVCLLCLAVIAVVLMWRFLLPQQHILTMMTADTFEGDELSTNGTRQEAGATPKLPLVAKLPTYEEREFARAAAEFEAASFKAMEKENFVEAPVVAAYCARWIMSKETATRKIGVGFYQLLRAAFPGKHIIMQRLSDVDCDPMKTSFPGSLQHIDILFSFGMPFPAWLVKPVQSFREAHKNDQEEGSKVRVDDLLLFPRKPLLVPHTKNRTFVVGMHEEAWAGENLWFDVIFTTHWMPPYNQGLSLYWPLSSRQFWEGDRQSNIIRDLIRLPDYDAAAILKKKQRFTAMLHRNCDMDFYSPQAATRIALYEVLKEYREDTDALGSCRGSPSVHQKWKNEIDDPNRSPQSNDRDGARQNMLPYKFGIAMENSYLHGYWTEKLMNPILADAVPIYSGFDDQPWIQRFINPKRFIYCKFRRELYEEKGFDAQRPNARIESARTNLKEDLQLCVDKVKAVDQNDTLWMEMVSAPVLLNNTLTDSVWDLRRIGRNFLTALKAHQSYLVQ